MFGSGFRVAGEHRQGAVIVPALCSTYNTIFLFLHLRQMIKDLWDGLVDIFEHYANNRGSSDPQLSSTVSLGNATGPFVTVTVANLGNNGLGFSVFFKATDPPVTVTKLGLGNATDPSVTVTVAYIQFHGFDLQRVPSKSTYYAQDSQPISVYFRVKTSDPEIQHKTNLMAMDGAMDGDHPRFMNVATSEVKPTLVIHGHSMTMN
ncbi:hypothetical protein C8R45DRAFT_926589 [Mycena sanguinolenta]|nr:hypothetical protein C8R45DRAFT_926589 [Mycena sanguinolenta]